MSAPALSQPRTRIAAFVSGGGSNMLAVHDFQQARGAQAAGEIVLVVSNRPTCAALGRATARGLTTAVLADPRDGAAVLALLAAHRIEVLVLAGYLAFVPDAVTRAFRGRIVNVHPSLLPAFGGHGMYGRHVHAAVLAAGARISGATVHFVDEIYDRGAIIAQWPVPVFEEDSPESLAERVLRVEHALLPRVVELLCAESLALDDDGTVHGVFLTGTQADVFSLQAAAPLDADLDRALNK
ncbi:MAG: phosphoribosylglycinamide formyltransferase [Gemmatimonadaceae bacterium]|nr:phosphoribosylglycinamide formyltransferase [Gemmatimonadaceae bacterium]